MPTGFKFDYVLPIPLKKAYFVLVIWNILDVPHCSIYYMKVKYLLIILAILAGDWSCQSVEKDDADNFFLKGNVQLTRKNYEEAIRYYQESIAKNPEFSDAFLNLGLAYLQLDQLDKAMEALSRAIEIDPELFPAYLARAETATRQGQWNVAEKDLDVLKKSYADSSQYYLIKGNMLVGKNNPSAALSEYDRSLELDAKNTEAYVNRGAVFFALKDYKSAYNDFKSALQLDLRQPEALNNLGLLASRTMQWDTALSYFDRALRVNAVDPFSLNNKGFVLLQTGETEAAAVLINRSLSNLPENGYALRNLGLYYMKKQDYKNATAAFDKALSLDQLVESLYGYAGAAYLQNGNQVKACDLWNKGIILGDSLAKENFQQNCR